MIIGDLEVTLISGGRLWIDGGCMFGPVPKTLWSAKHAPDEQNRIELDTNCLLVRSAAGIGLIDVGYGSKASPRECERFRLCAGHPLVENLAAVGIAPADVNWVILSHLHFDHVAGCTDLAGGLLRPVFPNATHFVQQTEWEDAAADLPELSGSYFPNDFLPLKQAGLVQLLDGDATLFPGVAVRQIGGHTRGQQLVLIGYANQRVVYLADLCPYATQLRSSWVMSYDQFPRDVRRSKAEVFAEAIRDRWLCVFSHDPIIRAAYLGEDARGNIVVDQAVDLASTKNYEGSL